MEKDYRLLKKLKKGDISEEEFSRVVVGDEFSNDNNDVSWIVLKKCKKGCIGKQGVGGWFFVYVVKNCICVLMDWVQGF